MNLGWLSLRPQLGTATSTTTHFIKGALGPVSFHLINDLQQLTETAFGESFNGKPLQVFSRQIKDWHTQRRKMLGTKLAKRHVGFFDRRHVCGHLTSKFVDLHGAALATMPQAANAQLPICQPSLLC